MRAGPMRVVDDLDIRPPSRLRTEAPGYSVERTLALPAFWRGAAGVRKALHGAGDDPLHSHRSIARAELIEGAVAAGKPLSAIPEFGAWLKAGGGR